MKTTKILISIILCLTLIFCFIACSEQDSLDCKLNKNEVTLKLDQDVVIEFTKDDITITDGIEWRSSDVKIATVSNGKVTGKKVGTCVITAIYEDKEYNCNVTVTTEDNYALDISSFILGKG